MSSRRVRHEQNRVRVTEPIPIRFATGHARAVAEWTVIVSTGLIGTVPFVLFLYAITLF